MAETLTMEPNVEKTSIDNLSAEEQDSLQVGEQMQEAQDNLLAGKYKNAEELEKGYLELQQKLNTKEEPAQEEQAEEQEEAELEAIKGTPALMKAPMFDPSKNQQVAQQQQQPPQQ